MFWKKVSSLIAGGVLIFALAGTGIAATYSDFTGDNLTLSRPGLSPVHDYTPFIQYRTFNLGSTALNSGSGVTHGDVVRLFNVLANTYIEQIGIRITTAASYTSSVSAEVGDGADIDGYIGHANYSGGDNFINFGAVSSGISVWGYIGETFAGTSAFMLSGVSLQDNDGTQALSTNLGAYFTGSGLSPYIGPDTIDMTVYNGSVATTQGAGVTVVFEAFIKGFKRLTN